MMILMIGYAIYYWFKVYGNPNNELIFANFWTAKYNKCAKEKNMLLLQEIL